MSIKEALCTTLAALVKERSELSHPQLAQRVGVSARSLRGYLSGDVWPDNHIDAILTEIGVSTTQYLLRTASQVTP